MLSQAAAVRLRVGTARGRGSGGGPSSRLTAARPPDTHTPKLPYVERAPQSCNAKRVIRRHNCWLEYDGQVARNLATQKRRHVADDRWRSESDAMDVLANRFRPRRRCVVAISSSK